jgi:HPt (histidine-containing phosphotransfer) domain-containing protein
MRRAMTINLEGIEWMPSPPLAPGLEAIDIAHLARMTLGERELEREVLNLYLQQSTLLIGRLAQQPPDAEAIAHTLKGAARAIGAFAVADFAEEVELLIRTGRTPTRAIAALSAAIDAAQSEIHGLLLKH